MKSRPITFLILLGLLLPFSLIAQPPRDRDTTLLGRRFVERRQEIEAIKKEVIGDRINLSAEQAAPFWNIYDRYTRERLVIRRQLNQLNRRGGSLAASDEQLNSEIDRRLAMHQKQVDLEKNLKVELLKVINVRQLAELYRAEQEFIRRLLEALLERDR